MKWLAAAPCQCHSPGGVTITSPGANAQEWSAAGLDKAFAFGDAQRLPEGMAVPGGVGARREVHPAQ